VIGENRQVKITDGVYNIAEYTYDALGRRIEMKTYDSGEVDSTTRYYYNNNWQVLAETDYDSSGPTETQLRDYIYGNYIDEVLIMTDDSDAEHYYGHDHIFSVVTLIEPDGDELSWGWWPYLHHPIISITKDNSKLSHA
jgi:YD repeat-containing protein